MSWPSLKDIGIYPTPLAMALYESHMTIKKYIYWEKKPTPNTPNSIPKELNRHMRSIATLLFFFLSIFNM